MNFKRAKVSSPRGKAMDMFKDDITDQSLTDEGNFTLVPGTEVELQSLYELMKVSDMCPVLTSENNALCYTVHEKENETQAKNREKRQQDTETKLVTPKSVIMYVANPDLHSKWTRVINDMTRIITTTEPIQCVETIDGPVLEACTRALWKSEVALLVANQDYSMCNIYAKQERVVLQFKLL